MFTLFSDQNIGILTTTKMAKENFYTATGDQSSTSTSLIHPSRAYISKDNIDVAIFT